MLMEQPTTSQQLVIIVKQQGDLLKELQEFREEVKPLLKSDKEKKTDDSESFSWQAKLFQYFEIAARSSIFNEVVAQIKFISIIRGFLLIYSICIGIAVLAVSLAIAYSIKFEGFIINELSKENEENENNEEWTSPFAYIKYPLIVMYFIACIVFIIFSLRQLLKLYFRFAPWQQLYIYSTIEKSRDQCLLLRDIILRQEGMSLKQTLADLENRPPMGIINTLIERVALEESCAAITHNELSQLSPQNLTALFGENEVITELLKSNNNNNVKFLKLQARSYRQPKPLKYFEGKTLWQSADTDGKSFDAYQRLRAQAGWVGFPSTKSNKNNANRSAPENANGTEFYKRFTLSSGIRGIVCGPFLFPNGIKNWLRCCCLPASLKVYDQKYNSSTAYASIIYNTFALLAQRASGAMCLFLGYVQFHDYKLQLDDILPASIFFKVLIALAEWGSHRQEDPNTLIRLLLKPAHDKLYKAFILALNIKTLELQKKSLNIKPTNTINKIDHHIQEFVRLSARARDENYNSNCVAFMRSGHTPLPRRQYPRIHLSVKELNQLVVGKKNDPDILYLNQQAEAVGQKKAKKHPALHESAQKHAYFFEEPNTHGPDDVGDSEDAGDAGDAGDVRVAPTPTKTPPKTAPVATVIATPCRTTQQPRPLRLPEIPNVRHPRVHETTARTRDRSSEAQAPSI